MADLPSLEEFRGYGNNFLRIGSVLLESVFG